MIFLDILVGRVVLLFGNLTESEKAQAAESLVGKNAMSGFLALMNAGEDDIAKLSSAIDNCDGSAEKMAMTMQDNLAGQLTILKSQLQELAISFGDILMPAIRSIVSKLQGFVDKLNGNGRRYKANHCYHCSFGCLNRSAACHHRNGHLKNRCSYAGGCKIGQLYQQTEVLFR